VLLLILILSGALPLLILILEAGAAPVNAKLRTTVRALAVMALVAAIALPALKRIRERQTQPSSAEPRCSGPGPPWPMRAPVLSGSS